MQSNAGCDRGKWIAWIWAASRGPGAGPARRESSSCRCPAGRKAVPEGSFPRFLARMPTPAPNGPVALSPVVSLPARQPLPEPPRSASEDAIVQALTDVRRPRPAVPSRRGSVAPGPSQPRGAGGASPRRPRPGRRRRAKGALSAPLWVTWATKRKRQFGQRLGAGCPPHSLVSSAAAWEFERVGEQVRAVGRQRVQGRRAQPLGVLVQQRPPAGRTWRSAPAAPARLPEAAPS